MTINPDDLINSILDGLAHMEHIHPEEIPNIDLYMDQVTTFMNTHLSETRRHPEDKILTKTMINNYAKNDLLPPPLKKKYSKEHMLLLVFIYYLKNILSITDIQSLLGPITERYFHGTSDFTVEQLYQDILSLEADRMDDLQENILAGYRAAMDSFRDAPEEEQQFLQLFAFVCILAFDVYIKKQLIEQLIDAVPEFSPRKK